MIVDIPSSVHDIAGMETWMTQNDTLRSRNAAVFFPRILIPDPLANGRLKEIAPSGTMAGFSPPRTGPAGFGKRQPALMPACAMFLSWFTTRWTGKTACSILWASTA